MDVEAYAHAPDRDDALWDEVVLGATAETLAAEDPAPYHP